MKFLGLMILTLVLSLNAFSSVYEPTLDELKQIFETGSMDYEVSLLDFNYQTIESDSPLSFINDLNQESAKVWNKMVTCTGDAEKVRQQYYHGKWACDQSNEIESELKLLKNNIENFFVQITFDIDPLDRVDISLSKLHPLFAQVLWEQLAYFVAHQVGPRRYSEQGKITLQLTPKYDREGFITKLVKFLYVYQPEHCRDMGLWPMTNRLVGVGAINENKPAYFEDIIKLVNGIGTGVMSRCGPVIANKKVARQALREFSSLFERSR